MLLDYLPFNSIEWIYSGGTLYFQSVPAAFNSIEWIRVSFSARVSGVYVDSLSIPLNGFSPDTFLNLINHQILLSFNSIEWILEVFPPV